MKKSKLKKKISENIARAFAIMFNRASMYRMDHPFTNQSLQELYDTVIDGLDLFSPVALILNRDQFYVEEEPFDSRLNTSRMAAHFKKAKIQSISFEKGMNADELKYFVKIFVDPVNYPKASSMQKALAAMRVRNVKINHVIYKKMTVDQEIVLRENGKGSSQSPADNQSKQMFANVLNRMTESVLMEEIEKSFSLKNLLEDPIRLSKNLVDKDLDVAKGTQAEAPDNGSFIAGQLMQIRDEVLKIEAGEEGLNLAELAEAVFDMRDELIKGMTAQKSLGVVYDNEEQIIDEANALADQVLIQLVREEYKDGKISTARLAQILHRMVPEPAELKRLLPSLKDALLEEGMSMSDFLDLMTALGEKLQNEQLTEIFHKSAKEVGLASEHLINEFKQDPAGVAELIYLASELRKGTGDDKILTDLLVDYIERIGSKIVLDASKKGKENDGDHLKKVMNNVESEIVSHLGKNGVDNDVLDAVQEKLMERMEMCFNQLKSEWESQQSETPAAEEIGQTTIFRILEESVGEENELHKILVQVRNSVKEGEIDENNIHQILKEITRVNKRKQSGKIRKNLPNGILTHNNTLFFIEKEIFRYNRYDTPFSVITFSVIKLEPKQPIPKGSINGHEINQYIMGELVKILREADLIGILTKKILVVLLPMTEEQNAQIAMKRILSRLHAKTITVKGIDLNVRFAGAVTSVDNEQTYDLESFLKVIEKDHNALLIRLRNIQELY